MGVAPYTDIADIEGIEYSAGDTLLGNIRPYLKKVWFANKSGACSADVLVVKPTDVIPEYLFNILAQDGFIEYVMSGVKGSKMPRGDKSHIMDYETAVPTDAEQEKIAYFLRLVSTRIQKTQILIESLKKYKRGLLQQIFSKKISIGTGDTSWECISLGELGHFFGGLTGKSKEDFEHGDATFITYMNVYKNAFADETLVTAVDVRPGEKQNAIKYGDILFTQSSETVEEVGLTSVWVHDTTPYLNSFCMALRPHSLKKYNPYYLGYVLRSPQIRQAIMKEGQGISRINLAASRIENILIPVPSISTQTKIADFLQKIDAKITANEKTLSGLISLKKAFLQSLFI